MNVIIETSRSFDREVKRLLKHYASFKNDFKNLISELRDNPDMGVDLGNGIHKVRMRITSKGKGKSGGARVITFTVFISTDEANVTLLYIYNKAQRSSITAVEINELLKQNGLM